MILTVPNLWNFWNSQNQILHPAFYERSLVAFVTQAVVKKILNMSEYRLVEYDYDS